MPFNQSLTSMSALIFYDTLLVIFVTFHEAEHFIIHSRLILQILLFYNLDFERYSVRGTLYG
jgi:hypothetical protein